MKKAASVLQRVPLSQARTHLGRLARRAYFNRECFILEKDGIPLAGIIGVDQLEDFLELRDPKLRKQIADGYEEYRRGEAQPARDFLARLQRETQKRRKLG